MQTDTLRQERIVRERERREITGVSTSSWYALQQQGLAPRPVPIGVAAIDEGNDANERPRDRGRFVAFSDDGPKELP